MSERVTIAHFCSIV